MKLLLIFAAILAFSLAEEKKKVEVVNDSEAEASATIELMKEGVDLNTAASSYNSYVPPSQRPPHWNVKPIQPIQTSVPANVQNDYYQWSTPVYHPPTTTTPVSVIKNEQYYGENGHYKYEYQIADGTHVGEEGYFTDPKQTEESLVKKGWYSYVGADGKKYTVTYWADHTGFHAYGDHLPTPPPPYKPVVENKPLYDYPTQTQAPAVFYPTQPAPVPVKPIYVPPQPTLPPVQQPTYAPQPSYPPQNYIPPQQTYYPPQQTYYPPQQNYYPQQNHV